MNSGVHYSDDSLNEQISHDAQPGIPVSVIDLRAFLANCLWKPSFASRLLNEFRTTAKERVSKIETALETHNLPSVGEFAHALKGVAEVLCTPSILAAAQLLEEACENNDVHLARHFSEQLKIEVERLVSLKVIESCVEQCVRQQ